MASPVHWHPAMGGLSRSKRLAVIVGMTTTPAASLTSNVIVTFFEVFLKKLMMYGVASLISAVLLISSE
jgi:hypothetical protein